MTTLEASDPTISQIRPMADRVFIKPDAPAEKIGSLFIPHTARAKTGTGTIVAMGPGMLKKDGTRWPMPDVPIGARVIYDAESPWPRIKVRDEEYLQLRDDAVLAVFE
jgi:chaperonin GroES